MSKKSDVCLVRENIQIREKLNELIHVAGRKQLCELSKKEDVPIYQSQLSRYMRGDKNNSLTQRQLVYLCKKLGWEIQVKLSRIEK